MSLDATRWAWQQAIKPPSAKFVLLSLADRADENHCCYPSVERLTLDTGMDRKTVMVALSTLEALGVIDAHRCHGKRTFYTLIGVPDRHQTASKNSANLDDDSAITGTKTGTALTPETDKRGTEIGTSPEIGTGTKNGTTVVPKTGLVPVPKTGHEPISKPINNQSSIPPPTKTRKTATRKKIGLDEFLQTCRDSGERAIPVDDPIFDYAVRIGLPEEFIALAWRWFRRGWVEKTQTGVKGWRQAFRNAVEGNWPKFWFRDSSGAWVLSTAGQQEQLNRDAEAKAQCKRQEAAA